MVAHGLAHKEGVEYLEHLVKSAASCLEVDSCGLKLLRKLASNSYSQPKAPGSQ